MIYTLLYGLSMGAILYFISVGLSLTFGTMRVINFAHTLTYTIGVYMLITFMAALQGSFLPAAVLAILAVIPVSYLMERFIIRRLYGESLDYTFIATFAITLIGVDTIKWIWGVNPYPLSDPLGSYLRVLDFTFPIYRIIIFLVAIALFVALELFFKKTIVGKIVVAALEDKDGVKCLGVKVDKYFSLMFILGSALAGLGGVLYAPISAVHPYMGLSVLLLAFAVVIVGGMGSYAGALVGALLIGIVEVTGGYVLGQTFGTAILYVLMIGFLLFRPSGLFGLRVVAR